MEHEVWRGLIASLLAFLAVVAFAFKARQVRNVLLVALILRIGLAFFHYFIAPLPDSQADAIMFESTARQWAAEGWQGLLSHWQSGALLYSWLVSLLYLLFGPSTLLAQVINVFLGIMIVYLVWRIGSELFDERMGKIASWIVCLFPTLNLYSALTMREAPFVFLLVLGVWRGVRWIKESKVKDFFWAVFFLVLATGLHLGAWPVIWGLGLWSIGKGFNQLFRAKSRPWGSLGELAIVGAACAFIVLCRWGWDKGGVFEVGVSTVQRAYAIGRAAYLQNLVAKNVFDLFWQVPLRLIYFLFTPFPWMVKEKVDLLGLFDAFLYLAIGVFIVYSMLLAYRRERRVFIGGCFVLMLFIFSLVAFAIVTSNYGAAVRHRAKFLPILAVLASPGIIRVRNLLWSCR